jgi:hypothetical protein
MPGCVFGGDFGGFIEAENLLQRHGTSSPALALRLIPCRAQSRAANRKLESRISRLPSVRNGNVALAALWLKRPAHRLSANHGS